jgi:hypothetical protein
VREHAAGAFVRLPCSNAAASATPAIGILHMLSPLLEKVGEDKGAARDCTLREFALSRK